MILRPVHDLHSHSLLGTLLFFVLTLPLPIIRENILEEMSNVPRFIPILDNPQFPSVVA